MNWMRIHPYLLTLIVAAVLVTGGAVVVASRAPVAPQQNGPSWSEGAPLATYPNYAGSAASPQEIVQAVVQGQTPSNLSIPVPGVKAATSAASQAPQNTQSSGAFDYLTLLDQMNTGASAHPSVQSSTTAGSAVNVYQFVPTGLIASAAPQGKQMSASQKVLYDYANSVGGEIQSFEDLHTDQAQVLKDQAEDRTNQAKAAAVVSLAQGYASIGTYMQQMQNVPDQVASLHAALAQSYLDIGAKLQLVAQAQGDAAFIQALENYDTAADTFVKNYGALAQYFTEYGVTFSQQDPGSVFSFTQTSGVGPGL